MFLQIITLIFIAIHYMLINLYNFVYFYILFVFFFSYIEGVSYINIYSLNDMFFSLFFNSVVKYSYFTIDFDIYNLCI